MFFYFFARGLLFFFARGLLFFCEGPFVFLRGAFCFFARGLLLFFEGPFAFFRGAFCFFSRGLLFLCEGRSVFSRGQATSPCRVGRSFPPSVRLSVCLSLIFLNSERFSERLLLLPNRPRLNCRVSGLVTFYIFLLLGREGGRDTHPSSVFFFLSLLFVCVSFQVLRVFISNDKSRNFLLAKKCFHRVQE